MTFTKVSQMMIILFPFFVVKNTCQYSCSTLSNYSFVRKTYSIILWFGNVFMNTS